MARWICPTPGCSIWTYAPAQRPKHPIAPNPNFQTTDPHCPVHKEALEYRLNDDFVPSFVVPAFVPATTSSSSSSSSSPKPDIGSVHDKLGVLVTRFEHLDVYCDYHQRKHVYKGHWPGQVPTDKPVYKEGIYDLAHLRLCKFVANSVPWGDFRTVVGGVDIIFDCGQTVVGTNGETYILLQGGFQKDGATHVITFHSYPVDDDGPRKNTFRSCKEHKRFFVLKDVAKYLSDDDEEKKVGKGKKEKDS